MSLVRDQRWQERLLLVGAGLIVSGCGTIEAPAPVSHHPLDRGWRQPVAGAPAPGPGSPSPAIDEVPEETGALPPREPARPKSAIYGATGAAGSPLPMRPRQGPNKTINHLDWRDYVNQAVKVFLPRAKVAEGDEFEVLAKVSVSEFARFLGISRSEFQANATSEIRSAPPLKAELLTSSRLELVNKPSSLARGFTSDELVWRWSIAAKDGAKGRQRLSFRVNPVIDGARDLEGGDPKEVSLEIDARPMLPNVILPIKDANAGTLPVVSPTDEGQRKEQPIVNPGKSEFEVFIQNNAQWLLGFIVVPLLGYFGRRWIEASGPKPKRSQRRK